MAADKRKILEAARKHAQKGAKEKALKEFGKLLKLDPRDSKVRLEMGDTYRRWGQVTEAVEAYLAVADQFMHEGFDARAVAVFKQIQNLQPQTFIYYEPLAELYQRMGLNAEAIGCLESAAESYRAAGQKQESLGLLRKMAAIDPSNTTSRIKVADLLQQEGMKEDAVSEYDAVVTELELQGDTEAVAKLFERILEIKPERIETLVLYARNLIDRGAAQRAESLAKRALELDRSPEQYELLADVYRMEQREEELVALYRELAEVYRERGDEERTREILQRHVPLDEFVSADAPNGYIGEDENLGGRESFLDELSIGDEATLLDGDLLSDTSLLVSDDDPGIGMLSRDGDLDALSPGSLDLISDSNEMTCLLSDEPSGGTSLGDFADAGAEIDASQLLVEASVYLRYGKRSQAIANLESILERDADHRLALEKLGEALVEGDDSAKAVEMWSRAAKLAAESGEADAAEVLRSRIAALDPAAAEGLELTVPGASELDADESPLTDELDESPLMDELDESPLMDEFDENPLMDELIGEASDDFSISDDLAAAPSDNASENLGGAELPELDLAEVSISDLEIEIDIDDASFSLKPSDEERAPEPDVEMAADDSASIAGADMDEISIDDLLVAGHVAESGEAELDDEGVDREALTVTGAGEGAVSPENITEDLEEADFYMEQGLLDEAEATYSRILSMVPNHPHAMVRLGELASLRGDDSGSVAFATDPASEVADSADIFSGEPSESDIGADLANWQENLLEDDAQESDDPSVGVDSGTLTPVAADWGLEDLSDLDDGLDADEGDSASADEQDDTGELLGVSAKPDFAEESDEPEGFDESEAFESEGLEESEELDESEALESEELDESEALDPVGVPESPVGLFSDTPDGDGEPAKGGDDLGFDLAAELSQSFDRDPGASSSGASRGAGRGDTSEDGFASVFAEFKKGVSETLTEGDHQAHYDLGIAYREMGLLKDAFAEFRLAMSAPDRRVGCLQLMGMCAHEMGEPEQAVGHFAEALASDGISEETLLAITLDLGKAHEAAGDFASARRAYEEIQAIDPNYADVVSRLDELEKPEDVEPQEGDSAKTEEYENFAEFLGDHDEPDAVEPDAAAGSTGAAEEAPVWESFDDVVAELDAEDDADSFSEEQEAAASAEFASETDDSEPAETARETETTPKQRRKKISFV